MRGRADGQGALFHVFSVESRIRQDHPLRGLRRIVDGILKELSPLFAKAYSQIGRPSVPPERLLKALFLMALYSIRSERQLVERIDTDLLFRWFLDMLPEEDVFDATVFTHNRPRLDEHGLTAAFFDAVLTKAVQAQSKTTPTEPIQTSTDHHRPSLTNSLTENTQNSALNNLNHPFSATC